MSSPESKPNPLLSIPIRTRVYHRSSSLLGFIIEKPCEIKNDNRYLIIYDNYSAYYHLQTDFHLCLCQDFDKHLTNVDHAELRTYYQHAFHQSNLSKQTNFLLGTIIRVKKFGTQYHNARIIDKDGSIIKICFFERKSQTEMWIHSNSSIIELSEDFYLSKKLRISSSSNDLTISNSERKRKTNINPITEGKVIVYYMLDDVEQLVACQTCKTH
jgi:hypothetical protein